MRAEIKLPPAGLWIGSALAMCACSITISFAPFSFEPPAAAATAGKSATMTLNPTAAAATVVPSRTPTAIPAVTPDPAAEPQGAIAFERGLYGGDGVYLVTPKADGPGELQYVKNECGNPEWSPDGRRLALRLMTMKDSPDDSFDWVDDLALINADGSGFEKLTAMDLGDRLWEFSWSPDGEGLAVVRTKQVRSGGGISYPDAAVYALKTDGSGIWKRIGDTNGIDAHVEWFPDSKRLAFLQPGGMLAVGSLADGTARSVAEANADWDGRRIFDVSVDGRWIAYLEYSESEYSLKRVTLEPGPGQPAEETLFTAEMDPDIQTLIPMAGDLALSPDGRYAVFFLIEPGKSVLQLYSFETGNVLPLAELTEYSEDIARLGPDANLIPASPNWKPGWSPDGQWIYYATAVSGQGWENGDLSILNLARVLAGTIEPILAAKNGRYPRWQPAMDE